MCRIRITVLACFALVFALRPPAFAQDEPTVLGKKAVEWLAMLREEKEVKRRQQALTALELIGPKVQGVVAGVAAALKDADAGIRKDAAQLLSRFGSNAKDAVEALAAALRGDKVDGNREAAATALGRIGAAARAAVPDLAAALKDKHAATRAAAAFALGRLGAEAVPALPQLREAL